MIKTTLIAHAPKATRVYLGSPSIAKLPSGALVASHDYFGPGSKAHELGTTEIYLSVDGGHNWNHTRTLKAAFWASLFVHQGELYLLGTSKEHGEVTIRRSPDGHTWTPPVTLLRGQWHTAPVPVLTHNGRIFRAIEDAHTGQQWPSRYRARLMSIAETADLLDPQAWSLSNALGSEHLTHLPATGWLEGNVVSDGTILTQVMRVESTEANHGAHLTVAKDGRLAFTAKELTPLPGGTKKFTIRFDTVSGRYLALTNPVLSEHTDVHPSHVRNTLTLISSSNLRDWDVHTTLLESDDAANHGFQYADWIFDGEDIAAVVRTALPHGSDTPHNFHDANQITFFRLKQFRTHVA